MAIGDTFAVDIGDVAGVHYVDTGMYDRAEYGSVYVVDADRPAVVDSGIGTNYEAILDGMAAVGVEPEDLAVIALTHVHLDHAGGAGYLAAECPDATVAIHRVGADHLVDPARLVEGTKRAVGDRWTHYADPKPVPADRIRELADGDVVNLGDRMLRTHHAPGHAPHQVVFEDPDAATVYTGDAAGIYVPGLDEVRETTPPPNFDREQALADVATVRDLDPEVLCYSHFGPARTADRLAEYEHVLDAWVERVAEKRAELGDDAAVAEALAAETDLGDVWGEEAARGERRMNVRGVCRYLEGL